jgi:periplasmic protein TonB
VTSEGIRWTLCVVFVALAHGWAWFALTTPDLTVESDAGSPMVTLELSPVSAAPAPAPDEPQADAQLDPQPAATQPVPQAEPTPESRADPTPPSTPEPLATQTAVDQPPPVAVSAPDVAYAPPPPPPEPSPTPEKETPGVVDIPPQPPSPPPIAPSVAAVATAETAAAPSVSPGREESISPAALQSWRRELVAQIERHKRFPANAKGQSGVVSLAFGIDRSGRLTGVRVLSSSGSSDLDQAAMDLIRRSQPFPAPPAALRENDLSFVAPVRYLPSGSH